MPDDNMQEQELPEDIQALLEGQRVGRSVHHSLTAEIQERDSLVGAERLKEAEKILAHQRSGRASHRALIAELPRTAHDNTKTAIVLEYTYGLLGLVLGFLAILGGIVLIFNGAVGSVYWTARILGAESTLNDATPGVVLCIVGVFVIWATKPTVRLRSSSPQMSKSGSRKKQQSHNSDV